MAEGSKKQPIIIRKYANRRLYNTEISSYVTLDDLCHMVKKGEDFVVKDAKTNEDLTKSVLTQIIFEQEGKGENLLPTEFLKNIIGYYDDSLKNVVPIYLNSMMKAFISKQEELRKSLNDASVGFNPFKQFEDIYKTSVTNQQQFFTQTMDMLKSFNPLVPPTDKKDGKK